MIEQPVTFNLPKPWDPQPFTVERFGELSFLVGPNGSGKSRFANELKAALPNARLLGTDRLEGMSLSSMSMFFGDSFAGGYQKNISLISEMQAKPAPASMPSLFWKSAPTFASLSRRP